MQGWERERLTPYQSEDPNPTTPIHRKKEEKGKTVGDKKGASSQANKKALALLLKPASPTPSNTGSLRAFHRDTERSTETKVRRYCEVLQRGGAKVYRCAITAPRVTRTGTYGTGRAPYKGCIGLHLILYRYIILKQIDDVQGHTQTHPHLKNWHH